ncbi:MAG: hypothetical protein BroJett012_07140 [Betaproteobacteria bacterium]|jgi:P-type conjugative transfer protein TrbJ|nr:MAG: hypothetical protein BroJett012_07140 [Betaproteobacteria bacterium]
MCKKHIIAVFALSFSLSFFPAPAMSGGGGLGGGATEATQMMNNAELVASYAKHAESVMVQINQYMTMLQNLQQLPASVLQEMFGSAFGDIAGTIGQYTQLYGRVSDLYTSARSVSQMLDMHGRAMDDLNMQPQQYVNNMIALSRTNRDYFRSVEEDAHRRIGNLERDMSAVQTYAQSIPNVQGNIQGLQTIAQGNAQISGLLVGIQGSMATANAIHARTYSDQQLMQQQQTSEAARMQELVRRMLAR